jgi:hypothetical protein
MEKSKHIGIIGVGKSNGLDISEILKQIQNGEIQTKPIEENCFGIDFSKYKNSIDGMENEK